MNTISYIILLVIFSLGIISCSSNEGQTATNQTESSESIGKPIDNGKALFQAKCSVCHGLDGTAGIANAANLKTSQSDSISIIQTITNGKNAMPAFKSQLEAEDINQVAEYVRSLRK